MNNAFNLVAGLIILAAFVIALFNGPSDAPQDPDVPDTTDPVDPMPDPQPEPDPAPEPEPEPEPDPEPVPEPEPDPEPPADDGGFTFKPAGELIPSSGSGFADSTNYREGIRFPIESAPAYLNSQVYRNGGSIESPENPRIGTDGEGNAILEFNQCDFSNYDYPWQDNFCENRNWKNGFCPNDKGHQGVDIRGATCENDTTVVVAAEDGTVVATAPHLVQIQSDDETTYYNYLHMSSVTVGYGDSVSRGQPIGKVSNLGSSGTPSTTIHLHFEIKQNFELDGEQGLHRVPPYATLIDAYQRLLGGTP